MRSTGHNHDPVTAPTAMQMIDSPAKMAIADDTATAVVVT
jgi:hypothetical protein